MLNVVIINGGRGGSTIIPNLIERPDLHVTSVVNAYDDGKSTGEIRRVFHMLGPSDIRKVQELMLPKENPSYLEHLSLFRFRFPVDCSSDYAQNQINKFVYSDSSNLIESVIISHKIRDSIKIFLKCFLQFTESIYDLNRHKFNFSDCSIMNCIYAGAYIFFNRDLQKTTRFIGQLFGLKGLVLSTSNENKTLVALRENGEMLYSEAEIVELRSNVKIERIFLIDRPVNKNEFERLNINQKRYYLDNHHCNVPISYSVNDAIKQSNIIIYAPGTQHSSLYPSYLSSGLAESIADNKNALKVFITNIGADYETPTYQASDYILGAYRYLLLSGQRKYLMDELFNFNLINKSNLKKDQTYVKFDKNNFTKLPVELILDEYESTNSPGKHDGKKIISTILDLYDKHLLKIS